MAKILSFFILLFATSCYTAEPQTKLIRYVALPDIETFEPGQGLARYPATQEDMDFFYQQEVEGNKIHSGYKIFNVTFQTYPRYLSALFELELKGFRPVKGINVPNWTIWTVPQIRVNNDRIVLELLTNGLAPLSTVGVVNLAQEDMTEDEAKDFCHSFINRHTAAERSLISTKPWIAPIEYQQYWTEIDQLIITNIMSSFPQDLEREDGIQNDEVSRQIGEFFQWRENVINFRRQMSDFKSMPPQNMGLVFTNFLKFIAHVDAAKAEAYGPLMDQRLLFVSLGMEEAKSDNNAFIDCIFTNMKAAGLFLTDDEMLMYRKAMFPRDADDEV